MDHGKHAVSSFPIATGAYYKVDYSPGTDISRYKNIPVPTSYMAYHSDFDFLGCYDHGTPACCTSPTTISCRARSNGRGATATSARRRDRQLTDADGPYIELMCGAFTDSQPDFSWLQPGEEKRFTQVFMPFKTIGGVKNASPAMLNLEISEGSRSSASTLPPAHCDCDPDNLNKVCFRQDRGVVAGSRISGQGSRCRSACFHSRSPSA